MANANFFPGSQTVIYATKETTYGVAKRVSGVDAMFTLSESLTPSEEREFRPDRSGSSDHTETYVGRRSAEFEISKLLLPSGSVTIHPDDKLLMEAAFGHISMGTTAIEFHMATAHDTSLTIRRGIRADTGISGSAALQEHINGAIVNRVEFAWGNQGNNDLATVTYSGMAKEWGFTGNSSISGTVGTSITSTVNQITASNALQLTRGSLVKFRATGDTGGGSGILVLSVNYTNATFSWAETLDHTHSHLDSIQPYNPTGTTGGSPIHARVGFISLDGSATQVEHLGGRITFEDNRTLLNEEVGNDSATQVLREAKRDVTFSLEFMAKRNEIGLLMGGMYNNTTVDIQVNVGGGTGGTYKFVMSKCKWDYVPIDIGESEMARIIMNGKALGTNGNDSLRVKIT